MPYSLISAATLGFDLVRLPAGRRVADVLVVGMAADADVLGRLAEQRPSHDADYDGFRDRARDLAAAAPRVFDLFDQGRADHGDRRSRLVAHLERGTIGDVANVERLIRTELLASGDEKSPRNQEISALAGDVLTDAAVGFWAADLLPAAVRRRLTAPFEAAVPDPDVGPVVDMGPAGRQLHEFFEELRHLDQAGRTLWRTAADVGSRKHGVWAAAMHEACWAAHISGRTRVAAAAQLHAVRAFLDGGLGRRDGARGVWNAVAGCVQSLATADLLGSEFFTVLQTPWFRTSAGRHAA